MSQQKPDLLVDTSVAVALVVGDHEHHDAVTGALAGLRLGLAGHAAFETYSVLTRMPPPARRTPQTVRQLLVHNFPLTRHLDPALASGLLDELAEKGIAGGSTYDALVAVAARTHRVRLATRDRRALDTYRAMDVELQIIE